MSEQVEQVKQAGPTPEWLLTDTESFRTCLPAMMRLGGRSGMNLAAMKAALGGTDLISAFLRGKQAHLRFDTVMRILAALNLEVVVRRKTVKKTKSRIENLRAERGLPVLDDPVKQKAVAALVPDDARDPDTGLLKRALTEAERRDIDALLDKYGSY